MGPGLNLMGWFWPREQISGPDHLAAFYTEADLQIIRSLGFRHVRLAVDPLLLFNEDDPEQLVEENLAYVDLAIDNILASGLAVTIDIHASFVSETGEFFETKPLEDRLASDPEYFQTFVQFWRALAGHFSTRDPERLFLEILNEPQFETEVWDSLQAELVSAIRQAAPEHTIIATGALWGSLEGLLEMTPVSDPNVVYSVHLYEPFVFTTQGAEWVAYLTEIQDLPYPSSPELVEAEVDRLRGLGAEDTAAMVEDYGAEAWDGAKVEAMIQTLADWGDEHNVRLIVNEFGVYSKAPPADRMRFIGDMRQAIEQRGIVWNMWDYSAGGYGIFGNGDSEVRRDITKVNPLLLEALGVGGASTPSTWFGWPGSAYSIT